MPVSYRFTEDSIEQRTLLQTKQFAVANLIALFRETTTMRTKQGQRRVRRVVLRFEPERTLKISTENSRRILFGQYVWSGYDVAC